MLRFDFAPDRALRQIADYSCRLNVDESNPEMKVEEFISFLLARSPYHKHHCCGYLLGRKESRERLKTLEIPGR